MGNIVLLDDLTINKIAAGEVIERPASVVKEVVENSIDAGADNISIEIKNGGISYIRITDNGKGIAADDTEIAFERHATSKIRKAEDLETVKSMGFRGEALASIAAIARVELVSKTEDSDVGNKIVVEGGKIISKEEIGCPKGTTITIENLFYNTPVRYKFLKKDFTESGYIEDVVTRIALVNPNIAIKFTNSGKTVVQTSGNNEIKDIVYSIYGKDIAENIINVDYEFEDMKVSGVVGKPSIARSNRANQLFFVNKRFVKDKTLTSATEQAFKGQLPMGKYGFLILNIDMDPHKLDVNVHPAKLEVRFQDENKVFKLVYHAVKEALLKVNSEEGLNNIHTESFIEKNYSDDYDKEESKSNETKGIGSFFKNMKFKNDFGSNEKNLVEELYNDKINHEKNDIYGSFHTDALNEDEEAKPVDTNGIDYKFNSISTKTLANETQEKYDNLSVDENGKIDITEDKKENLSFAEMKKEKITEDLEAFLRRNNVDTSKFDLEKKQKDIDDSFEKAEAAEAEELKKIEETIEAEDKKEEEEEPIVEEKKIVEPDKTEEIVHPKENKEAKKEKEVSFEEMYAKMFGTQISKTNKEPVPDKKEFKMPEEDMKPTENLSLFMDKNTYSGPIYKFIGIAFDSYILIEYEKELYIIDQQAANARILYEKIKKNYYSDTDKDAQLMLLPDIINLTPKEMGVAKDNLELFRKAGFDLEEFGDNTIKINGVPNICLDLDTKDLFLNTLEEINTVARTAKHEVEEKLIETIASKVAEKSQIALTEPEVDNLMQKLLVLDNPFTVTEGKIAAIKISKIDIEKKFSRR